MNSLHQLHYSLGKASQIAAVACRRQVGSDRIYMPKARALIDSASLGPDALKAANRAFDEAWREIASHFSHDPIQLEGARLGLASAVLSIVSEDSRDVEVLKTTALQVMASNYTSLPIATKLEIARRALMDAQQWQNRAEEVRQLALAATDPLIKNELRDIAYGYERIARLTRKQTQPHDRTKT